ncbi:hypothetical protein C8J56DRAFT_990741 [Mycena floridula]|nr:hypothetical protein C8J56DRAFT_990741 [Mycena floridula]
MLLIFALSLIIFRTAGLTISAPDFHLGDTLFCTWIAETSDPATFNLEVIANGGPIVSTQQVDRNGQISGKEGLEPIAFEGLYNLQAFPIDSTQVISGVQFQVLPNTLSTSSPTRQSFATEVRSTTRSASPTMDTDTSKTTNRASSDRSATFSKTSSIISETDVGRTNTISSSITMNFSTRPSSTAISSQTSVTPKRFNVGALVGGILAGLICFSLLSLWILCRRRRRHIQRLHTTSLSPWTMLHSIPSSSEAPSASPRDMFSPTGQLTSTQATQISNEKPLMEMETEVRVGPILEGSSEFTRTLITEIARLNDENEQLRGLNRSDWAEGLRDTLPPPSYPHSESNLKYQPESNLRFVES